MRFIWIIFFLSFVSLTTASAKTSAAAQEHLRRGEKFLSQGEYDAAIVEFTRAIRVNSEADGTSLSAKKQAEEPDPLQIVVVDKFNATAFFNRGSAWFGKGRADKALDDFTRAIRLDPRYAPAWMNRGTVLQIKCTPNLIARNRFAASVHKRTVAGGFRFTALPELSKAVLPLIFGEPVRHFVRLNRPDEVALRVNRTAFCEQSPGRSSGSVLRRN